MPKRLLFLTGEAEASALAPFLEKHNPVCSVEPVSTRAALETAILGDVEATRLLAFCTSVIVPSRLLDLLPGPSYNIHPGPPTFPGRHPECWGAYHSAPRFGATLHEMAARVDEGPIIDVNWFDMPSGGGQLDYGVQAFQAAVQLFIRWAGALVLDPSPLPRSGEAWSGHKSTRAEIDAMCRMGAEIDAAEFRRRQRAFAEQAGVRLTVMLHGVEFHHITPMPPEDNGKK